MKRGLIFLMVAIICLTGMFWALSQMSEAERKCWASFGLDKRACDEMISKKEPK